MRVENAGNLQAFDLSTFPLIFGESSTKLNHRRESNPIPMKVGLHCIVACECEEMIQDTAYSIQHNYKLQPRRIHNTYGLAGSLIYALPQPKVK